MLDKDLQMKGQSWADREGTQNKQKSRKKATEKNEERSHFLETLNGEIQKEIKSNNRYQFLETKSEREKWEAFQCQSRQRRTAPRGSRKDKKEGPRDAFECAETGPIISQS